MDKVSKREFLHHIAKYLKPGKVILTNRGKDEYVITIECCNNKDVITSTNVITKKVVSSPLDAVTIEIVSRYGCGCKKTEGKYLCPKHSRQ